MHRCPKEGIDLMKHQVTRELFTYWDGLRGGRTAPERSDIDPAEIHQILGDTFILEYENQDSLNFRLAGTRLCGSFCRELKGRSFLDLWEAGGSVQHQAAIDRSG